MPELLILGGTRFVGKQIALAALDAGYRVTVFNRGQTDLGELTGRVRVLVGDRDPRVGAGLSALEEAIAGGARWEAVVDANGYVPRLVRASAELLHGACDRYLFISTVSVYANFGVAGLHEGSELAVLDGVDEIGEVVDGRTYGPLKVLCEGVVEEVLGDRGLVVRPGLVVGPGDYTDRFTFWPARLACRDRVVGPMDAADQAVQVIDGRDLALFVVSLLSSPCGGDLPRVFNAVGESGGKAGGSLGDLIEFSRSACVTLGRPPAEVVWVEPGVFERAGLVAWQDVPMWLGESGLAGGDKWGFMRVDGSRARSSGLDCRPIARTVLDTLSWWLSQGDRSGGAVGGLAAGMSEEREAALLAAIDAGSV